MIHTIRTVAVGDQESKIDSPIILYRGDREVEVEFTINGSKFTFTNGGNVIKSTNATHGQLVINTPTGENMFSEVTECHDGKVVFVITKEMIDELIEVGFYSFQIRLFDESQVSRVTIPPVLKGIDIRNPIAAEDETNVVDIGLVDYAVVVKDEFEDLSTFLPDGNYNKTEWESKDVISGAKLNKIEDALYNINSNMEATDLALLNRIENINQNVNREFADFKYEIENGVEELERDIDKNIEMLKIDIKTTLNNEVHEMIEYVNECFEGVVLNVKDYGALGNGVNDDTEAIQNTLDVASEYVGCVVYVPAGVYRTSSPLSIFSNTNLLLSPDATIKRLQGGNMLLNGLYKGTTQHSNITVEGGTWDMDNGHDGCWGGSHFTFGNCENITIRNVKFLNNHGNHAIDFGGVTKGLIENCTFEGFLMETVGETRDFVEAIQIADFTAEGQPSFSGVFNDKYSSDITVNKCVVKVGSGRYSAPWPVGVGHHGINSTGECSRNIVIENSKFYGCTKYGVRTYSFTKVVVRGCNFKDCWQGVHITNIGTYEITDVYEGALPSEDIIVENCTFEDLTKHGVWCNGKADANDLIVDQYAGYAKQIRVSNSIFKNITTSDGHCIQVVLSKGVTIHDCYFENSFRPIFYKSCEEVTITNNKSINSANEFLYSDFSTIGDTKVGSYRIAISNNIIDGCNRNGIYVRKTDLFDISSNIVCNCSLSDASRGGVRITYESSYGAVNGNVVKGDNHAYDIHIEADSSFVVSSGNVCKTINDLQTT